MKDTARNVSAIFRGDKALIGIRLEVRLIGAVLVILALALGLRLYGLSWDQGFSYTPHPDERAILMKTEQLSFPALAALDLLFDADQSPWNPRWFPYGSFPLYLLKGVQLTASLGPGDGIQDLRLPGRVISALADVATVFVVFLLGARVYGRRVGLVASALVGLAVMHIQMGHFFAVDTLLALFAVAAVYFMVKVAREGRIRDSVLAGIFVGLGLATKVSLAPIIAPLVMAHLMYALSLGGGMDIESSPFSRRSAVALTGLILGLLAAVAVFFVVQPYAFLDWSTFIGDFVEQSEMVRRIRDYPYTRQYIDTAPYWYHVRQLATWGLGPPLGVVAWAGLVYVSLRGLRVGYWPVYLIAGWGVPIAILLTSTSYLAIFVAAGVALLTLLVTLPLRTPDTRTDSLLLSWVAPFFLITGALEVKFLRYLIPITPFLVLFGSRMLWAAWDFAKTSRPALRAWVAAGFALVIGGTAFYALSYLSVYSESHSAVQASRWINSNVPDGSVILKEHWEEGLPDLHRYEVRELRLYEGDTPQKIQELARELANGDYLVLFSQRLYGTIPRLPERYPLTSNYYEELFSGILGYELVRFESAGPRLLGVGLEEDTFARSDIPEPELLRAYRPAPLTLSMGFADESFSVYDHPKVMVFQNVDRLPADALRKSMEDGVAPSFASTTGVDADEVGLMLSPKDARAQQSGGTWSDIVHPRSWTNRVPVLSWLMLVEGIGLLALPVALVVFRPLADRGFLFSKLLGLLLVGLVVWLLASLQWTAFSRVSIFVAIVLLYLVSAAILIRERHDIAAFLRRRWPVLLIGELLFVVAFLSFLMVRMANPDLWHPHLGGEKPMDMAYLNAVLRSTFMPPYDPWYAGGYLNYYYWGQFLVATLIKATGIGPTVAFNLAIPLFFALTVGGSYAVVYNLAEGTRRKLRGPAAALSTIVQGRHHGRGYEETARHEPHPSLDHIESETSSVADERSSEQEGHHWPKRIPFARRLWQGGDRRVLRGAAEDRGMHWSPVTAGLAGALFVTVLGNLDGAIQVGHGVWRVLVLHTPFGKFDFWRSTRMMPPDPPGHEITEFPFFTFLFGDLHAHLMALPFTILVLGLALAVVLNGAREGGFARGSRMDGVVRLAVLGVAVGSLRLINAWDFPTYLLIAVVSVFLAEYFAHGGSGLVVLWKSVLKSLFVFAVGYLAFLPFHLNFEASYGRWYWPLESTTNTTPLWQFLAISGTFVFIIGSFFVGESRSLLARLWKPVIIRLVLVARVAAVSDRDAEAAESPRVGVASVLGLILAALSIGFLLTAVFSFKLIGSTIPFTAVLLALVLAAWAGWLSGSRPDSPYLSFAAVLVGVALAVAIGLDVLRFERDIDRMNSVFKFYLQIWVLLGLGAAYLLWRLAHGRRLSWRGLGWRGRAWLGALAALIVSASIYPVLGTHDRLGRRFDGETLPLTLDGVAFVEGTAYRDERGNIDLAADYVGIRWLQDNVQGSPVVLEAVTPAYRWGNRVSIYTGLPTVVGWQWHQEQQRWNYRHTISARIEDVNNIYTTRDIPLALSLMRRYGVSYIYVGQLERLYYPPEGLGKFDEMLGDSLERVFQSDQVSIYRVQGSVT